MNDGEHRLIYCEDGILKDAYKTVRINNVHRLCERT